MNSERRKAAGRRGGFTIAEMVVATVLSGILAMLLAGAVAAFARPAAEVDGRTRLALEASLTAEALARDLGGYLVPDDTGSRGSLQDCRLTGDPPTTDSSVLTLTFSGVGEVSQYTVAYRRVGTELVRDQSPGQSGVVVAQHVADFLVAPESDGPKITLTLQYPDPKLDPDSPDRGAVPSFRGVYVLHVQWPTWPGS
jgi:type II secretory pathway pseudopilin PulG